MDSMRNRAKELLSRKTIDFQRSNPFLKATHEVTETLELKDEFVFPFKHYSDFFLKLLSNTRYV